MSGEELCVNVKSRSVVDGAEPLERSTIGAQRNSSVGSRPAALSTAANLFSCVHVYLLALLTGRGCLQSSGGYRTIFKYLQ